MLRCGLLAACVLSLVFAAASPVVAQTTWPDYPLTGQKVPRGDGNYLNVAKVISTWLLFLLWVKMADWVSQDVQKLRLGYQRWNPAVFFSFIGAMIVLWMVPIFLVGFSFVFLATFAPFTAYVLVRNRRAAPSEKVFTPQHIRFWLSEKLGKVGVKIEAESRDPREKGPPVELTAQGAATQRDNNANLLAARQLPGLFLVRQLIADTIDQRGSAVMLDYGQDAVTVRYQIDGVWHEGEGQLREQADMSLEVMKTIAALKPQERQARQAGTFGAEYHGGIYTCRLTSQGAKTGERVLVQLDGAYHKGKRLPDVGMREKMFEQYKQVLETPPGFIVIAAPAGEGLSTLYTASMGSMDRYLRSFSAVEEKTAAGETDMENVPVKTYDAAAGESPEQILPKLLREYPDVVVVRQPPNAATLEILCQQIEENRTVLTTIRASESAEALLRVLMMKVTPAHFARAVTGVICQRLVRKLCETCKEAYTPSPQMLKQLGIPAGKIESLYRVPEAPEKVCPDCVGIGYYGQHAIFELLIPNDAVRQALVNTPTLNVVRTEARKAGMKTFQEEGILLVARGITSIDELRRVLSPKPQRT